MIETKSEKKMFSAAVSCIPIIGEAKDLGEVVTGKDAITKEDLTLRERALTAVGLVLPVVGGPAVRQLAEGAIAYGIIKNSNEIGKVVNGSAVAKLGSAEVIKGGVKSTDEIVTTLKSAGLNQAKIEEILSTPKDTRPSPATYLSNEYINSHLSEFEEGVTKIMPNAPTGTIGSRGGVFVISSKQADKLIQIADGDVSKLEQLLGFDKGSLGANPVRVDIDSPNGLRMPSGNELGANNLWKPGGYTSGGIKEAVIDPAHIGTYQINNVE